MLSFYNAATGLSLESLPGAIGTWTTFIMGLGIMLSLLLLFGIVYAHMRLEQIEADAKHRRHDLVDELLGKHHVKNERWEHVKELMTSTSQVNWRNAIIEADIMLYEMLTALGVPGDTIGEKLKLINRNSFNTIDLAWEAHLVRNEIAHAGSTYILTERDARSVIDKFRQVFEEFSFI